MTRKFIPILDRFHNGYTHEPETGCWIWQRALRKGYGYLMDQPPSRRKVPAHRFSYESHKGQIPEGHLVRHTCDKPSCVNPAHLIAGTPKENTTDMFKRGRAPSQDGENNPASKLTVPQVIEIKKLLANTKLLHWEIADMFGVKRGTITQINTGDNWKTVGV